MNQSLVGAGFGAAAVICFACSCDEPSGTGTAPAKGTPAASAADVAPAVDTATKDTKGAPVKIDMSMVALMFKADPLAPKVRNRGKARVALGKKLYHEVALSRGGDISCASCHSLETWGQDGKKTSPGTGGAAGKRNTPTTFNAFRQFAQFWDYRAKTVEEQATMPILTANEHGLKDNAEIVSVLQAIPDYAELFKKAFPKDDEPLTAANVGQAIGAFERKLVTHSRWDDFVEGKADALTNAEKAGLKEFMVVGCTTCHMTRLLGGSIPQKFGLVVPVKSEDTGREQVTGNAGEKMFFKVPQLLNVAETAPYYHDGSIATLEESVAHMAKHQLGRSLTDAQTKSITAFLKALTGKPQW